LELYRYAQTLSLIEGPLRIADNTNFPDRQWMLDLAEWNITKALAALWRILLPRPMWRLFGWRTAIRKRGPCIAFRRRALNVPLIGYLFH
jgi:hypothetical protein